MPQPQKRNLVWRPLFLLGAATFLTHCTTDLTPSWFAFRGGEFSLRTQRTVVAGIKPGWVRSDGSFSPIPLEGDWSCSLWECKTTTSHGTFAVRREEIPVNQETLVRYTLTFTPGVPWGISWELEDREILAGLGMTFVGLNLKGYRLPLQLELMLHAEAAINEVHLPLATLVSSRGYGILRRTDAPGWVDLGKLDPRRGFLLSLDATAPVEVLSGDPEAISLYFLRAQGGWSGVPVWALGLFFWRNENRHAEEMIADLYDFKARGYPLSVLWFDNPWETARNTYVPDPARIPDLPGLIATLRSAGVRFMLWISPNMNLPEFEEPPYREAARALAREVREKDLMVRDGEGNPLLGPWGSGFGYLLDFTRPHVLVWLRERLRPLLLAGVQGWKLDYGEDLLPWVLSPGVSQRPALSEGDVLTAHAVYKRAYHRAFRTLTQEVHGEEIFLLSRTGGFGEVAISQCLWPGDMNNDFSENELFRHPPGSKDGGLPAVILATLHLNVSGVPCLASDTGGFRGGTPDPLVFMRWAAFSAYQPVMQLGGGGEHRPFAEVFQNTPVEEVVRFFTREHAFLAPYFYELVALARKGEALPVYPLHLKGLTPDPYLYRLGSELLVRPVTTPSGTIETSLPPGVWIEVFTGTRVEGGTPLKETLPLDRIGLWQKPGGFVLRLRELPDPFPGTVTELAALPVIPYFAPALSGTPITRRFASLWGEWVIEQTPSATTLTFPPGVSEARVTLAALPCSPELTGALSLPDPLPQQGWFALRSPEGRLRFRCPGF